MSYFYFFLGDELHQKIETEQSEIERLHQEIVELQYLRQDSDLDDMSSSSESSYESEDEDELQEILNQLIRDNELLEASIKIKPSKDISKYHILSSGNYNFVNLFDMRKFGYFTIS